MRRTKEQKAITLIALIITIVVLLILAAVAISSITNDGIIQYAQNATKGYNEAQEKEHIQLTINEWSLAKYSQAGKTFAEFLGEEFGASNVVDNGDNTYNVTVESGNIYKVQENGTITPAKGISIAGAGNSLMLEEGKTVTETLTATLVGISGEITWSNENNSVATISATTGVSITVTAVAKGETKVTATCSGYTAVYTVKVKEPAVVKVGSYVSYDVSYTDMYQGTEYTSTNGWRYLGTDEEGNKLLISTAIPAVLYYYYNPDTLPTWWATDEEVQADTGLYNTTAGWDYDNSGYPNKYAAYGLRYKFESIPFTYQASGTSVSTKNTGIFRQVGNTTSGTSLSLNFKASGVDVEEVHNLTLAELNKATNSATGGSRAETSISEGFKDLTDEAIGLFDMQDLTGYTANYYYWLASPNAGSTLSVCYVNYGNGYVGNNGSSYYGVRPVVVLSSDVEIVDENEDGVYEIQ